MYSVDIENDINKIKLCHITKEQAQNILAYMGSIETIEKTEKTRLFHSAY